MTPSHLCRLFVPEGCDTDLLRACLGDPPMGIEAFERWSLVPPRAIASVQAAGGLKRRLLPLLHAKLNKAGVAAPPELQPILRAAHLYEELRTRAYREIAGAVLAELRVAQIPFVAMRGVVFAAKLYGPRVYRHCHDIDLLLGPESLEAAAAVLVDRCACTPVGERSEGGLVLTHASGLPIALHGEVFRSRAYRLSWAQLYERSTVLEAYGTECRVLGTEDSLLQLIVHASMGADGRSLLWLCDAWQILRRGGIDWAALLLRMDAGGMTLPCLIALAYLEGELGAGVPSEFLESLRHLAAALPRAQRRHAEALMLLDLQTSLPGGRTQLLGRALGWRQWLRLLLVLLFPPASVLQASGRIIARRDALAFWCRRLGRGLARRVHSSRGSIAGFS